MAENNLKVKVQVELNKDGLLRFEKAIECLKRIAHPRSAFKDHPGRSWSYRDYELRQIARHTLKEIGIEFEP